MVFLGSQVGPDMSYLEQKLGIKSKGELLAKLLARVEELDLKRLSQDVEPFLINVNDRQTVLEFEEFAKKLFS